MYEGWVIWGEQPQEWTLNSKLFCIGVSTFLVPSQQLYHQSSIIISLDPILQHFPAFQSTDVRLFLHRSSPRVSGGLLIWCYFKWGDVFTVLCSSQQIFSSFSTGFVCAYSDARKSEMNWNMENAVSRVCNIVKHKLHLKVPLALILVGTWIQSFALNRLFSQFSLESNIVYCWLTRETPFLQREN